MPHQKTSKQEIIEKCTLVFREQSYHSTTMLDLAKACDMTKGIFYHYFTSKEELMHEILQFYHQRLQTKLFALAYDESQPARARLEAMSAYSQKLFGRGRGGCLMGNMVLETVHSNPEFLPLLRAFFAAWAGALAHLYATALPAEAAAEAAQTTIIQVEGAVMLMQLYDDRSYLDKALQRAIEVI